MSESESSDNRIGYPFHSEISGVGTPGILNFATSPILRHIFLRLMSLGFAASGIADIYTGYFMAQTKLRDLTINVRSCKPAVNPYYTRCGTALLYPLYKHISALFKCFVFKIGIDIIAKLNYYKLGIGCEAIAARLRGILIISAIPLLEGFKALRVLKEAAIKFIEYSGRIP